MFTLSLSPGQFPYDLSRFSASLRVSFASWGYPEHVAWCHMGLWVAPNYLS